MPQRETVDQKDLRRLADIQEKRRTLEARQKEIEQRIRSRAQKREMQQKILLGGLVLSELEADERIRQWLAEVVPKHRLRDDELVALRMLGMDLGVPDPLEGAPRRGERHDTPEPTGLTTLGNQQQE